MRGKLSILFILISLFLGHAQYQTLTDQAEISVLTIEPGTLLYDSFGHNAFRVKDTGMDLVFNYGVYDFDTPNFYTKFAQGKLNYKLAVNYFEDSKNYYMRQNRTINEQILNLTKEQKQAVFNFLIENYKPENQYYLYDFFYDNCATKIKDVLVKSQSKQIIFNNPDNFKEKTFRELIHDHVTWNTWGRVGIDIALGSVIDKKATPQEHMFLPKYIHDFFASALFKNGNKLVKKEINIYQRKEFTPKHNFWTSPFFVFSIIALLIILITYRDYKNTYQSKWLDILLFSITGLVGVVILLLWLATDHTATANNYNLLWAFTPNLFTLLALIKKQPKPWFRKYLKFLVMLLVLMGLHWLIGLQVFALALLPFLIALLIRYVYIINHLRTISD